jgi:pimeloyl-ACP methyl ester carboxylesterase
MPRVRVGDADVAYEVQGEGDPLVLLHGSTGSGAHWAQVTPGLLERFRVVLPEYAGGGGATDGGRPLEVDDLVAQVLAVADDVGAERFGLAGWSLGAVTAAALAAVAPERVSALTLVCGWAVSDARMNFTFDLWRRLFETDRELFARYTFADGATAQLFELLGEGVEALIEPTAASFSSGSGRHAELDRRIDIADRLDAIRAPTLVVGGVEDRWVPIGHGRDLASTIAGARLVELDCGHLVPLERAAELTALLREHHGG